MSAVFKPDETFRNDFTYSNSVRAIRRFPLPFAADQYMYSVNIEPHLPGPRGCQSLPHMLSAEWDCLELIMESLARDYPAHFSLTRSGNRWHWINRPLGIDQAFIFGDVDTLPREPLDYIGRQAQGDFVVMDQREGDLWTEAGVVTAQADWSLDFDVGMTF